MTSVFDPPFKVGDLVRPLVGGHGEVLSIDRKRGTAYVQLGTDGPFRHYKMKRLRLGDAETYLHRFGCEPPRRSRYNT